MEAENYQEAQLMSKDIQLKLLRGELKYDDDKVQFFIPVALYFTDFDWLKIIADNILIKEDAEVVKNFLIQAETLKNVNSELLTVNVLDKLQRIFGEDFDD